MAVLATASAAPRSTVPVRTDGTVEVVVTLPQPPLAEATFMGRRLASATHRLDLRAPATVSYLRALQTAQRALAARIEARIPSADVRWHYDVTLNGMAVVVPRSQLSTLQHIPGATVWPSVTYHSLDDRSTQLVGAPSVWGQTLATAGQGIKIGVIDDGLDQTHPFFNPAGFSYPAGFPKGNTQYTTPKVIVARAFAPANETWKYARTPFDPVNSDHATHVSGIAAGDHDTIATFGGAKLTISGVAPAAYLGNYKVLTVPTDDFGLDGNSPEIAAGIEQAVKDGMDVINLSLGEPEVEPTRDIVVKAIDAAADAGVVPVIAAGNAFGEAGHGGIGSPANAPEAITVAASTEGGADGPADVIAGFSDSAPTPLSLQLKPDVTAPGVGILSSLPGNQWDRWDGTSMATPHVAGAAALLKQRHPTWTVEQIKSALVSTGDPVHPGSASTTAEVSVMREGGGRIDLARADNPLIFTSPTNLSFGLLQRGANATQQLTLADAGGGLAGWTPAVAQQAGVAGATVSVSPTYAVTVAVASTAVEGDGYGFITLTRGTDVRRVPYWFHVEIPLLGTEPQQAISKPGVYHGDTAGKKSLVSRYRWPEQGLACNCKTGVPLDLSGPEQIFRFTLKKPVANFGVAVLSHATGVTVAPRIVVDGDENRLAGFSALPVDINPYRQYGRVVPSVGAVLPKAGVYDIVFDTPSGAKPGAFSFRFWINDTTPPKVRALAPASRQIRLAITDAGAGVDPGSITLTVDGRNVPYSFARNILTVKNVAPGTHRVVVIVGDYQEPKNMEDVGPVLPNTRTFSARLAVR
ncbi:MAG: S8 family serine peptidase [Actinomycetota bacterium]